MSAQIGHITGDLTNAISWSVPVDVRAAGKKVVSGPDPKAEIVFTDVADARRILLSRDAMTFAEAYIHGIMDIQGDIYSAISVKEQFYPENVGLLDKAQIIFNILRSYRRHTVNNDRGYIAHHYEHPDEFYRLFLGRTMTYSCAYFSGQGGSLDEAQERKAEYLLAKLRLRQGERLLDIGCGWGSLVIKASQNYGARSLGVTLSRTQEAYANERIEELGLKDSCRVELLDYRQLDDSEQFDKIVSVGMYEHVGARNLNAYFKKVFNLLRSDGLFVNHGITRKIQPDWRKASEARFVDKYIFPGGELHPSKRVIEGMEIAGFEVYDVESLRKHYARTLRHWVDNLQKNALEARKLVSEPVYRSWVLYLAGCALTFEEGYFNVHQACGSKSERFGGNEIAMTRAHLYS